MLVALSLQAITRYPVKSCRGEALHTALVEPWGVAGDRRWMVVDNDGVVITARKFPQLVLVTACLRADGSLQLRHPHLAPVQVDVPGVSGQRRLMPVTVWSSTLDAADAGEQAHGWFSKVLGTPARLLYLDDPTRRRPNPAFSTSADRVSLADAYPLLLPTTASLDALNALISAGPRAEEAPLPMTRFRPNVVVDGATPWAEDGWRRLRIGEAVFRAVKGCDRCVLTLVDPETARRGKEPIATLSRHRRWNGKTWFGMNLIPDTPGAAIDVGDEVEILESVPAPDGPPR